MSWQIKSFKLPLIVDVVMNGAKYILHEPFIDYCSFLYSLGSNAIGDEGATALAEALKFNHSLKKLE